MLVVTDNSEGQWPETERLEGAACASTTPDNTLRIEITIAGVKADCLRILTSGRAPADIGRAEGKGGKLGIFGIDPVSSFDVLEGLQSQLGHPH